MTREQFDALINYINIKTRQAVETAKGNTPCQDNIVQAYTYMEEAFRPFEPSP